MAEATTPPPVEEQPLPDPATCDLSEIDVSDGRLLQNDCWQPYFERLRREDPVHQHHDTPFGDYWPDTTAPRKRDSESSEEAR